MDKVFSSVLHVMRLIKHTSYRPIVFIGQINSTRTYKRKILQGKHQSSYELRKY